MKFVFILAASPHPLPEQKKPWPCKNKKKLRLAVTVDIVTSFVVDLRRGVSGLMRLTMFSSILVIIKRLPDQDVIIF